MKNYTELLKGVNKMDTQDIMNMYEENSVYTLSEFVEIFEEFDDEQQRIFCKLVQELDFIEVIEIVEKYDYSIYDSLEDYIYSQLEECYEFNIPNWLCINIIGTYLCSLRYEDNLYFMSDTPKWAKDGEEYGESEKRQLWYDGIKCLCETSEVLYIYR